MQRKKSKVERCGGCKYGELTRFIGYLECKKKPDTSVYYTDKACDDWEAKE